MIGFASSFSPLTNSSNVGSVLWERFHNQTQDYYYYFICVPPIVWIRESDHHLWSVFLIYLNNVCITIYHSFHGSLKQSIIPFYSEFLPYKRSQAGFDPPKQSATQVLKLSHHGWTYFHLLILSILFWPLICWRQVLFW